MTIARRILIVLAVLFTFGAYIAAFIDLMLCGLLAAAAAALVLTAGLLRHLQGLSDDCGYNTTPFGLDGQPVISRVIHEPERALTVIDGGKRPTWPTEAGAPE